jgi:DDE superfamily endonuclease/Tc5 transposase DNA-binding domain
MPTDREHCIEQAILAHRNGLSLPKAASKWGVPWETVRNRLHGAVTMATAKESFQRLSPSQEQYLVNWILHEESCGRAPSKAQARRFATKIIHAGGDLTPLGKHWLNGFLSRHFAIRTKVGKPISAARATYTTKGAIVNFFNRLEHHITTKKIGPTHITNMDENGVQEGETEQGKVLGTRLTRRSWKKKSDATAWVTIVESITAIGNRLSPLVIFPGQSLQARWFPEEIPSWQFDHSPSGWINAEIALKWLKLIYLPETKPANPSQWRLLLVDQHSSHISVDFMWEAYTNKVVVLYLPAHSTYVTQPLDMAVFSALKTYYHQATADWASYDITAPIAKQEFIRAYFSASERAFTSHNIREGFSATGLWPINRHKILDQEGLFVEEGDQLRPSTPPSQPHSRAIKTPQKSQDINKHIALLRRRSSKIDRDRLTLFQKAGKALDMKNARIAVLEAENNHLSTELKGIKITKKRPVRYNPNDQFADIVAIHESQEELRRAMEPKQVAQPISQPHSQPICVNNSAPFKEMVFEWQS